MDDPRVLVAGEALIDLFPTTAGPIAEAETLRRRAGGAPANVAVGLARLGTPPLLWTRLGEDPFGDYLATVVTDAGIHDALLERAISLADVVKTDQEDLSVLLGDADEDEVARAVLGMGPHTVLLTRGSEGATARASTEAPWGPAEAEFEGYDVDVVETTGAGDAFVAGTIAALDLQEATIPEALRYASAVGALATTATGAMDGLPSADAVSELLVAADRGE